MAEDIDGLEVSNFAYNAFVDNTLRENIVDVASRNVNFGYANGQYYDNSQDMFGSEKTNREVREEQKKEDRKESEELYLIYELNKSYKKNSKKIKEASKITSKNTNENPLLADANSSILQGLHIGNLTVQLVDFTTGVITVPFDLDFQPGLGPTLITGNAAQGFTINKRALTPDDMSNINPNRVYFTYLQLGTDGRRTTQWGSFPRPSNPNFGFTRNNIIIR